MSNHLLDTPKTSFNTSSPTGSTGHLASISSSSPLGSSSSTLASSVPQSSKHAHHRSTHHHLADHHAMDTIMIDDNSSSSSSDVEIEVLEERNGSPAPTAAKRKQPQQHDQDSSKSQGKKPKLVSTPKAADTTPTATPKASNKSSDNFKATQNPASTASCSTKKASTSNSATATPKPNAEPTAPVDFVKAKFVMKQKPFDATKIPSAIERLTVFTTEFAKRFHEDDSFQLTEYPEEHHAVIAVMINESPKTLVGVAQTVRGELIKALDGALLGLAMQDEESQEDEGKSVADRVPLGPIKSLISSIATRTNHGLDTSSVDLPEGVTELAQGLQIWSWEINDSSLLPSELQTRLSKRKHEREDVKMACQELWDALTETERNGVLQGKTVTATGSGSKASPETISKKVKEPKELKQPSAKKKEKKAPTVKTEEEIKAIEEKQRVKAQEEQEKQEKQAARKEVADQKAAEKATKEAKKAEKLAAEEKKQKVLSKQAGFMSMFVVKKTPSPAAPSDVTTNAAGERVQESDFNRVFLDFHVKSNVEIAPTNRFKKSRKEAAGKLFEVQINGDESLTKETALAQFLRGVPARRIPPRRTNPRPPVSVRMLAEDITQCAVTGADPKPLLKVLQDRSKVQVKLLKFREDVRPGYVGTWTKWSRTIRPRAPYEVDRGLINYDYDSEADWEEEEDDPLAEDLRSGDEMSGDEGSDADSMNDFYCDDDEVEYEAGVNSDDEVRMDDDESEDAELIAARRKVERREKKGKASNKREIKTLIPVIKGPCWESKVGEPADKAFKEMRIQFINDACVGLDPFHWVSKPITPDSSRSLTAKGKAKALIQGGALNESTNATITPGMTGGGGGGKKTSGRPATVLADEIVAKLISLIHGSETTSKLSLLEDAYGRLNRLGVQKVPKLALQKKWDELAPSKVDSATIKGKKVWNVNAETRAKYGVA